MTFDYQRAQNTAKRLIKRFGFKCTLSKLPEGFGPTSPHDKRAEPEPTLHEVIAVQDYKQIRDQSGTLIGETRRTLTIDATGAIPEKQDKIAVGVARADVTMFTKFDSITEVRPLAPGGVAVLYEVDLAR